MAAVGVHQKFFMTAWGEGGPCGYIGV